MNHRFKKYEVILNDINSLRKQRVSHLYVIHKGNTFKYMNGRCGSGISGLTHLHICTFHNLHINVFLRMQLPFFYTDQIAETGALLTLNEETSKHVVNVLRMKQGEQLHLTNGKGILLTVEIVNDHKKRCEVIIKSVNNQTVPATRVTIAISLLKNASRFEWFLEKATEIGVMGIVPLLCDRTERQHFRKERMEAVLISAMLQSRQCWLPELHEPLKYSEYLNTVSDSSNHQKLIAHCDELNPGNNLSTIKAFKHSTILIGPEGDFSKDEIQSALDHKFIPVSLGETRLRTETAGIVAAALLKFA